MNAVHVSTNFNALDTLIRSNRQPAKDIFDFENLETVRLLSAAVILVATAAIYFSAIL